MSLTWPEAREQARECNWEWAATCPKDVPQVEFVRTGYDKRGWPRGPWDDEPDLVIFGSPTKPRIRCVVWRHPDSGALCGHVRLQKKHPLFGFDLDEPRVQALEVLNGVTFAGADPYHHSSDWYLGFTSDIITDYCPALKARYLHTVTHIVRQADLGESPNEKMPADEVAEARRRLPELRAEVLEPYDVRRDTTPLRPKYHRYARVRAETEKLATQLAAMVRL